MVVVLDERTSIYPAPACVCSGKGPEYIAQALRRWCKDMGPTTYIELVSTCQNDFAEYFNSRSRDEFLNTELLAMVVEARAWPTLTLGVQKPRATFASAGAYAPAGSSTSCCITTHSHSVWTNEGWHINLN